MCHALHQKPGINTEQRGTCPSPPQTSAMQCGNLRYAKCGAVAEHSGGIDLPLTEYRDEAKPSTNVER